MGYQSSNNKNLIDDNYDETTAILTFEKKMRRKDSVGWIISALLIFFFTVIAVGRVTLVGQFLDDAIFNLLFGWFKYVVYFLLLIFGLSIFIGFKFHLKKRIKWMMLVLILLLCWLVSSILLIYEYTQHTIGIFNRNILMIVMGNYFSNWKNASIFSGQNLSFLGFNGQWIILAAGGGLIGNFLAGITSYLSIFGSFILSLICLFLWTSWVFTGHPLGFFSPLLVKKNGKKLKILKIESNPNKRNKKNKNNNLLEEINLINSNKHATRQVIHSTEDSDITIEMPSFSDYRSSIVEELMGETNREKENRQNYVSFDKFQQKKNRGIKINYENLDDLNYEKKDNFNPFEDYNFNTVSRAEMEKVRDQIMTSTGVTPFRKLDPNYGNLEETQSWAHTENYEGSAIEKTDFSKIEDEEYAPIIEKVAPTTTVFSDIEKNHFSFNKDLELHNQMINKRINTMSNLEGQTDNGEIKNVQTNLFSANKLNNSANVVQSAVSNKKKTVYKLPPLSLLNEVNNNSEGHITNEQTAQNKVELINDVFNQFNIAASVKNYHIGPTITKFEIGMAPGVKVNKITGLENDLKYALATQNVRIEAPIQGKSAVGIEVANKISNKVGLREVIAKVPNEKEENKLLVAIGKSVNGENIFVELNKMPHLLVAGSTGSGKSVCINTILASILMRAKPDEVKLLLIDPKQVELVIYNNLPHLLTPVITNPKLAHGVLKKIIAEMERRYKTLSEYGARNIETYNAKVSESEAMPYIVIVIDELADLMMVTGKEIEDDIMRITQLARAAGIHLIIATQRPSTDVITGVIKTNVPSRISFAVASAIDSRTILDQSGAEKLIGYGDMLYAPAGQNIPTRAQGAYISDEELEKIIRFCVAQQGPNFEEDFLVQSNETDATSNDKGNNFDDLYYEVKRFVILNQKASTSLVQRKFSIGYNRASNIIDMLEANGVIGPQNGAKPREVYIKNVDLDDNNY